MILKLSLLLFVLILTSLACQVGAPAVDTEATVAAAIQATKDAEPTATLTPTPTSTETPLPTETPPPTETPAPAEPPTLTPLPTGVVTSEATTADWTRYDFWADGFSISLPNSWQPLTTDPAMMDSLMEAAGENNANIESMFSSEYMQALVTQGIKLMALDTDPGALTSDIPTNVNVLSTDLPITIDLDTLIEVTLAQLEQVFTFVEPIQHERITVGPDQLDAERLVYVIEQVNSLGKTVTARMVQYILLDGETQYVLTFTGVHEATAPPLPIFEEIAQTFEFIEP